MLTAKDTARRLAREAAAFAVSVVAPPRCPLCRGACASREPVCGACADAIRSSRGGWCAIGGVDACWSATDYRGTPQRLVSALKFGGRTTLIGVAVARIVAGAPADLLAGTLVPVPSAPLRRRRRGFDPAEELALGLGAALRLPVSRCLRRRAGPRQVGRSRADRLARPPRIAVAEAPPARALLVDDVTTTGATLTACARALHAAGAERVDAITFSRTPPG